MASKTLLILLGLTIVAVAYTAYVEEEVETEEDKLSVEELQEYFSAQQMEKRGKKVGSCFLPNGDLCALCNLKVKNKNDRRRYIACKSGRGL